MARTMNIEAIKGALRSSKTPAGLKKGLMKKYGHLLGGAKVPMETLATTMKPNVMGGGSAFHSYTKRHPKFGGQWWHVVDGGEDKISHTYSMTKVQVKKNHDWVSGPYKTKEGALKSMERVAHQKNPRRRFKHFKKGDSFGGYTVVGGDSRHGYVVTSHKTGKKYVVGERDLHQLREEYSSLKKRGINPVPTC